MKTCIKEEESRSWRKKCSNCGSPGWIFDSNLNEITKKELLKTAKEQLMFRFNAERYICQKCCDNGVHR